MKFLIDRICPQCAMPKLKMFEELTGEQKFLIERLPSSAEFTSAERKRHLFCTNCWNEVSEEKSGEC